MPHFNQITAVAFSDILHFSLGLEGHGLGVVTLFTSLLLWSGCCGILRGPVFETEATQVHNVVEILW